MLRKGVISSFFFASLSSILLSLSMPRQNLNLSILEWFALVPWLAAVRGKGRLHTFIISLWAGVFFWGITIYWLRLVTGLGFFLLLPYLGLYFAIFGTALNCIKGAYIFIAGPILWMALELIRGVLFGGFPWLNLAHGQYLNIPLLQWASVAGEGAISGIIVLVNLVIVAIILSCGKKRQALIYAFFLIIISAYGGGFFLLKRGQEEKTVLKAAVIQPNIVEKWTQSMEEKFDILMELSRSSLKYAPEFIIWPESSFTEDLEKEGVRLEILKRFSAENRCYLLVGSIKELPHGGFYNRAALISPGGGISSYDKVKLVPFGEYVPLGWRAPAFKRWVEKIAGYTYSFVAAEKQNTLYIEGIPFGTLICFEDVFPSLSRNYKRSGARFLVNITDDHWYGDTPAPYQHLAASVLRAAENKLPLVRASNTGVSAFIDSRGRISGIVKKDGAALFVRDFGVEEVLF